MAKKISVRALRGRALRRGYRVVKIRKKDLFYLVEIATGYTTVATDSGLTEEEIYFNRNELAEYLEIEQLLSEQGEDNGSS